MCTTFQLRTTALVIFSISLSGIDCFWENRIKFSLSISSQFRDSGTFIIMCLSLILTKILSCQNSLTKFSDHLSGLSEQSFYILPVRKFLKNQLYQVKRLKSRYHEVQRTLSNVDVTAQLAIISKYLQLHTPHISHWSQAGNMHLKCV